MDTLYHTDTERSKPDKQFVCNLSNYSFQCITANFKNKNSDEEAKIEEISGVAALFNQKFFADLKSETDIDLENIVYYKVRIFEFIR